MGFRDKDKRPEDEQKEALEGFDKRAHELEQTAAYGTPVADEQPAGGSQETWGDDIFQDAPEGSVVAAPAEPQPEIMTPDGAKPQALRRARRDRERQRQQALLDLGGLVVEMARRERMRVDLLSHRASIVVTLDREIAAIDEAIAARRSARGTRTAAAPAAATACPQCGESVPAAANYCPSCGASVLREEEPAAS